MPKPPKILRFESELKLIKDMTESVREFTFSTPTDFAFSAGQFITLLFDAQGKTIRRPYSIASSPNEMEYIRLCIKRIDGGAGSAFLWNLHIGDKVKFIGPLGNFVAKKEQHNNPLFFISTGTGVAPFASMIADLLENGFLHPVTLICGFRHDTLYHEQFLVLTKKYPNFLYKPILSRPRDDKQSQEIEHGRIQQIVERDIFTDDDDAQFYICGLNEMIKQTVSLLESKGIKKERIHFERYD